MVYINNGDHPSTKTDRNREVIELRKTMSVIDIANKFGISRARVYRILDRKSNP